MGPAELRLLRVDHWGLDGRVHRGELIVHRDHARRILVVLEKLFKARYPIQRLRLVDAYQADDDPVDGRQQHLGVQLPPGVEVEPLVGARLQSRDRPQPAAQPVRDPGRAGVAARQAAVRRPGPGGPPA